MFKYLEQRVIQSFLDMYPPFTPNRGIGISVEDQKQFYDFMYNVYAVLLEKPQLLFKTLRDDDAYPNRYNKASYNKPALKRHIKSDTKRVNDFVHFLYTIGKSMIMTDQTYHLNDDVKIPRKYIDILPEIGIIADEGRLHSSKYPCVFEAWKWMSNLEGMDATRFARSMFDLSYNYLESTFAKMFSDVDAYNNLCSYLSENNYVAYPMLRGENKLDYIQGISDKETKIGDPKHGDHDHIGITFEYDVDVQVPQSMIVRIQKMKDILNAFHTFPEPLHSFIVDHTKRCDGCNYCIQTDKTGKRPRAFIVVEHKGKKSPLCPLYPGFTFTFEKITQKDYENIISFLMHMNQVISS